MEERFEPVRGKERREVGEESGEVIEEEDIDRPMLTEAGLGTPHNPHLGLGRLEKAQT